MPLGYGYIKRDADSYVNWAKIGSDMSTMLTAENKRREDIKADVDAKNRELAIKLADSPDGQHSTARQAALDLANNASQFNLMQTRLLKSGRLKYKDFIINRQNLNDGVDRGFQALKNFQQVYGDKMQRYRDGVSSEYEVKAMERAEGFGDFTKSGFFVNPINGKINLAMKELQNVNGKDMYVMSEAPQNLASTDYLDGIISGKWNKFDANTSTTNFASSMGKNIWSTLQKAKGVNYTGSITQFLDATKKEYSDIQFEFKKAEKDQVNAILANPFSRLSVLVDNNITDKNNKRYTTTWDANEAKANPNMVLLERDPRTNQDIPKFTKEQEDASADFLIQQARLKYDKTQETQSFSIAQTYQQPAQQFNPYQYQANKDQEEAKVAQMYWNDIYTGATAQIKKNAVQKLLGTKYAQLQGIRALNFHKNGKFDILYDNSNKNVIGLDFMDNATNQPINFSDFSQKGVYVSGVDDRNAVIKAGGASGSFGAIPMEEWEGVSFQKGSGGTETKNDPRKTKAYLTMQNIYGTEYAERMLNTIQENQ